MSGARLLFRTASAEDALLLRFRLDYPRRVRACDRDVLGTLWRRLSLDDQRTAARAAREFARFVERTQTPMAYVPHARMWLASGAWRQPWAQRTEPLASLGTCMWNAGRALYPFEPECADAAVVIGAGGLHYCAVHGRTLGLKVKVAA